MMRFFKRHTEPAEAEPAVERRSAVQIYLDGGGDPADARTMALLAEADRTSNRSPATAPRSDGHQQAGGAAEPSPLHAYEATANDAALIRMMAAANWGSNVTVTLPSGRTITGDEMRRWTEADQAGGDRQ